MGAAAPGHCENTVNDFSILNNCNTLAKFRPSHAFMEIFLSPPLIGWLKLNTDGAFNLNGAGYGFVIRNHYGIALHVGYGKCESSSALDSEMHAIISAIMLIKNAQLNKIWIECDSQIVVNDIIHREKFLSWRLFSNWCRTLKHLDNFNFVITHTFRDENTLEIGRAHV